MKYFFLLPLVIISQLVFSQENPKWQIDVSSGFYLATKSPPGLNSLGAYNQDLIPFETDEISKEFALTDLALSIGATYQWKDFLNVGIKFSYCGPLDTRSKSISSSRVDRILVTSSMAEYQSAGLQIKLDALYKDFYEELNLIFGVDYNLLYYKVYSNDVADNPTSPIFTSNGFTRTMRQLRYFNFNLGLEWRDYITEHFGYFIQLTYNPTIRTNTHSLLFERVVINGETHPIEGTRIKPGENGYPEENFEFMFINLSLGLTYQW